MKKLKKKKRLQTIEHSGMEEVNRIDKTNLNQLSFLILLYLLVTWGSQQQNKEKNKG